jgi:hypothetical protein
MQLVNIKMQKNIKKFEEKHLNGTKMQFINQVVHKMQVVLQELQKKNFKELQGGCNKCQNFADK